MLNFKHGIPFQSRNYNTLCRQAGTHPLNFGNTYRTFGVFLPAKRTQLGKVRRYNVRRPYKPAHMLCHIPAGIVQHSVVAQHGVNKPHGAFFPAAQ